MSLSIEAAGFVLAVSQADALSRAAPLAQDPQAYATAQASIFAALMRGVDGDDRPQHESLVPLVPARELGFRSFRCAGWHLCAPP